MLISVLVLTAASASASALASSSEAPTKRRFVPPNLAGLATSWKRDGSSEASLTQWNRSVLYTAPVTIGTPAQTFDLRIDTGTAITYVYDGACAAPQCAGRKGFLGAASSSYQVANNNTATVDSVGGSVTGVWGADSLSVAGSSASSVLFLRASDVSDANAESQASGVLGLARGQGAVLNSLAAKWDDKRFGIYLARLGGDTWVSWLKGNGGVQSAPGGGLILGGVDSAKYTGEIAYAPAQGDAGWTVQLSALSAGMAQVDLAGHTAAMVDTGSSLVYGPGDTVEALYAAIPGARRVDVGLRADVALYAFPCGADLSVSFWLAGREFPMLGDSLVGDITSVDGETLCTGSIVGVLHSNDTVKWTLGTMFLRNVYTVFRLEPPAVGFADLADDVRPARTPLAHTMLPLVASLTGNASVTDALSTIPLPSSTAASKPSGAVRVSRDAVAIVLVLVTWATLLVFAPSVSPLFVVN